MEQYLIHEYKQADFKIGQLVKFLTPYARKDPKEELEDIVEQKENQKAKEEEWQATKKESQEWHVYVDDKNFTSQVLDKTDANLIYFTVLPEDQPITAEYKYFNKLTRQLKGPVTVSVFRLDPHAENFNDLKKKYKVTTIDTMKPKLRYYPNVATGDNKV
jgi:hypothetical protein